MPVRNDCWVDARAPGSLAVELHAVHALSATIQVELKGVLPDHPACQAWPGTEGQAGIPPARRRQRNPPMQESFCSAGS